jgi:hypothetical protein
MRQVYFSGQVGHVIDFLGKRRRSNEILSRFKDMSGAVARPSRCTGRLDRRSAVL